MRPPTPDGADADAVPVGDPPEIEASLRRQRTLDAIQGVNAQFLDVLSECARDTRTEFPLALNVRSSLQTLDDSDLFQLSRCGVLLVDAGFSDLARWRAATAVPDMRSIAEETQWLPERSALLLAHTTLHVVWSVLRWNREEAALLLGVPSETADLVASLAVKDLSKIAEQKSHWVQPRWAHHPRAWLDLIEFTRTGAAGGFATLRALQLSGGHSPYFTPDASNSR